MATSVITDMLSLRQSPFGYNGGFWYTRAVLQF